MQAHFRQYRSKIHIENTSSDCQENDNDELEGAKTTNPNTMDTETGKSLYNGTKDGKSATENGHFHAELKSIGSNRL